MTEGSGFEAKIPAVMRLGRVVRDKIAALEPRAREIGVPDSSIGFVELAEQSPFSVSFGEVEAMVIETLMKEPDEFGGAAFVDVQLWSDGSPYAREQDIAVLHSAVSGLDHYAVVCLPEYPPFLLHKGFDIAQFSAAKHEPVDSSRTIRSYLAAAQEGRAPEPWLLNEDTASRLMLAVEKIPASDVVYETPRF